MSYSNRDEDIPDEVTVLLEAANISVVIARSFSQAWSIGTSQRFDLYLLDGLMQKGAALFLCERLHGYAPQKPILFYSEAASSEEISRGADAGAAGYIVKPYHGDLAELVRFEAEQPSLYELAL